MGVQRIPQTIYASDEKQSLNTAKIQIEFIEANLPALKEHTRNAEKIINDFSSIKAELMSKGFITDKQRSYIDSMYEKVMKALGFGGFINTFKPRRR